MTDQGLDRRTVIRSAGVVGAGVAGAGLLAACGSSDPSTSTAGGAATTPAGTTTAGTSATSGTSSTDTGTSTTSATSAAAGGGVTVAVADVPVGGGTILTDALVVVTQPTSGEFKAFSATCTHQGCTVTKVENAKIICPCHNSQFDITTGEPRSGDRATKPLPGKTATVSGGSVSVT